MGILKKPLITEKFNRLSEKFNQFAFIVEKKASKPEIISEIEKIYSVNVTGISTMVYAGKVKSRSTNRGQFNGKRTAFKKAFVTLKEDQKIDFFQNV
jgi:large subunit ribosomal protein L23